MQRKWLLLLLGHNADDLSQQNRYGADGLQVNYGSYPEHVPPHEQTLSSSKEGFASNYPVASPQQSPSPHERTIFGLRKGIFTIVTMVSVAIVLAGALGGGLGAGLSKKSSSSSSQSSSPTTETVTVTAPSCSASDPLNTASDTASTATSTASAACPTQSSDCPDSDGKGYTALSFAGGYNGPIGSGAEKGLAFKKFCGEDLSGGVNLVQGDAASFDKCIDLCASYNFWDNSTLCKGVSYRSDGICWIKGEGLEGFTSEGLDSALLSG